MAELEVVTLSIHIQFVQQIAIQTTLPSVVASATPTTSKVAALYKRTRPTSNGKCAGKNNGEAILKLIEKNLILSSHDVSSGGLITAVSEMALSSDYGVNIFKPKNLTNLYKYFFGEDQARYIVEVETSNLQKAEKILKDNNIFHEIIGCTQKEFFEIEGELKISTKELFKINNEWYSNY